ncbi:MAG TPA: sugar phosphate nucleotidyltransferase [Candidatus Kapabacteria bacterium]|nr:sugar phosphate nucleotidyltransferase [Candidatus Kapabacteria bacterium]
MRAVIPVAGIGSRMRPHTFTTPKVLLNVAGKPILAHILDELSHIGIKDITIITGLMGDRIIDFVRKKYPDLNFEFVNQDETLGLGHAIWTARETYHNEELVIILGDTIFDVNLKQVIALQQSSLGVKPVNDPRRFGVVFLNEDGTVKKLIEKPTDPESNLAIVGIYFIKDSSKLVWALEELIKKNVRTKNEFQLTDALQLMIEQGEKFTTFNVEGWYDCGKPETLLETNRFLLEKIAKDLTIEGSVVIQPSYVSKNATIEHSVIGPYASIADNAIVKDSIVRDSIISYGADVENTMLDESIIGNEALVNGVFQKLNVGESSTIDYSRNFEK